MTKLKESLIENMCELIRRGWTRENICRKVGISQSSYTAWRKNGEEILKQYDFDEILARKEIKKNKILREHDKQIMLIHLNFAVKTYEAFGDAYGLLEEVAYSGALNDETGRTAIEVLQRRRPRDWAKQVAPAVLIESHPIKQIIIHGSEPKQLVEPNSVEAEYEDV